MLFAAIGAEGPFPGDQATAPYWVIHLDDRPVTQTTMSIDHSIDPLSIDHHCAPHIDCSFKRLVAARRLGGAVVWTCPWLARAARRGSAGRRRSLRPRRSNARRLE